MPETNTSNDEETRTITITGRKSLGYSGSVKGIPYAIRGAILSRSLYDSTKRKEEREGVRSERSEFHYPIHCTYEDAVNALFFAHRYLEFTAITYYQSGAGLQAFIIEAF